MSKKFWAKKIIGYIILAFCLFSIFSYVLMWLWNHVLVDVLHVSVVSYWQAFGILLLSKILFGGFKSEFDRHRGGGWKKEMQEKWHTMTPEEREKIKEEWRNRCRVWGKKDNGPMTGTE